MYSKKLNFIIFLILISSCSGNYTGNEEEFKNSITRVNTDNNSDIVKFVTVGASGTCLTSPNGIKWNSINTGITENLNGIVYKNNLFIAVGDNGRIISSEDSINWTMQNSGSSTFLHSLTYGSNLFVVVGDQNLKSTDGISWDNISMSRNGTMFGVNFLNNSFITLGAMGVINTSSDGSSWIRRTVNQTLGNNYQINAVGFGNGVYVAVGDGEVFVSSDSITWDQKTSGTIWRLTSILFDTNIFIKIGYEGSIYTSESGTSWAQSISGTRNNLYDLTVIK